MLGIHKILQIPQHYRFRLFEYVQVQTSFSAITTSATFLEIK